MKTGKVYLTGGGCGDAGFLTLKALDVLRDCSVVVYDSLVPEELLELTRAGCEKIYVGKRYGNHAMKQDEINALLVQKAQEGKTVVRLKGGDPYVFGRGGEEFLALQKAGICCEEIPGISSAIAVPAAAGIPVTHRGLSASVTVVTGTAADTEGQESLQMDFDTLARLDGTLVVLMGMHHLQEIADGLIEAGKSPDTACAVIMEGTTKRQRCMRTVLSRLPAEASTQGFTAPAVIVIGAVAALDLRAGNGEIPEEQKEETPAGQTEDAWVTKVTFADIVPEEQMADKAWPHKKVTVGVTGTPHFVQKMSAALEELNMQARERYSEEDEDMQACDESASAWTGSFAIRDMGFMEIRPNDKPLPDMNDCRWLVFTSPNGVRVFIDKMKQERKDLRILAGKRIAVIGPGTAAALENNGLFADYMPEVYDAAHLAEGLTRRIMAERQAVLAAERTQDAAGASAAQCVDGEAVRTLFLRAKQGSDQLPRIFEEKGIPYIEYPLYELEVREEKRAVVIAKQPDYIVFGSAMGVRAYFEGMEAAGMCNEKSRYVCIGPVCAEELRKHTERDFLVAEEAVAEAVVKCLYEDIAMAVS